MALPLNFLDIFDLPDWRVRSVTPNAHAVGGCICSDLRTTEDRQPHIYQLVSSAILNSYHVKNDGWSLVNGAVGLAGTFGAGAACVMMPSRGPRGVLAAGSTTTSVVLSTALPASVGVNQLADRGDLRGFKIRIIHNAAGGAGIIEERICIANSSGATPTIQLDSPLSQAPAAGCGYEFLSGRVYLLGAATTAAGTFKCYDILTNTLLASLSNTNLPATISTDSAFVALDEGYIPCDAEVSTGFYGKCAVTNATATTATITTPWDMKASEVVNLQVRVVQDTVNPTAVGQRRRITASTAGTLSTVLTVATWTVTPSTSALVVIENVNDLVLFTSGVATTYTYDQEANTWSTTTYAARGSAVAAGVMAFQPFGVSKADYSADPNRNFRWTTIHSFRGAATAPCPLDVLNLHAATAGTWENGAVYGSGPLFTTGSCLAYDSCGYESTSKKMGRGRFAYINGSATSQFYRYNAYARQLNEWAPIRLPQGTAVVGGRMAMVGAFDTEMTANVPNVKCGFVFCLRSSGTEFFDALTQR